MNCLLLECCESNRSKHFIKKEKKIDEQKYFCESCNCKLVQKPAQSVITYDTVIYFCRTNCYYTWLKQFN